MNLDFRQYIPTWLGQVLVWQVKFETSLGDEIPFQMLSTVGGSDNIRGIRERKFLGNSMFEFQTEYRIPIWWRLKAAIFCSVGDVFDIYNPSIVKPKVGYGVGLRCRLNDARVHLRVDVAGNNYGEWKFYITATEAF
jgi:outer membrane protein assembly factor BamA